MKDKILGILGLSEAALQILLLILFTFLLVIDYIFWEHFVDYGMLVLLSLPPLIILLWWATESKSKLIFFSFFLDCFVLIIYFFFFWVCNMECENRRLLFLSFLFCFLFLMRFKSEFSSFNFLFFSGCFVLIICIFFFFFWICNISAHSWCYSQLLLNDKDHYLSAKPIILQSLIYGVISMTSCLLGLGMRKEPSIENGLSRITKNLVFISVAVAIYLFLLERILKGEKSEYDPFMISFLSIAVAMSSLYVIFGYFSLDDNGKPIPLIFLISSGLSFSIGFTFSILVLEFVKRVGVLPTHWVFLCIWTSFVASSAVAISRNISGLSTFLEKVLISLSKEL